MSKIASLKKKAADLEKKSPDKAIPVYVELLNEMEKEPTEMDLALFNRVGDLMVKAGKVTDAIDYYEKAVDHYVDGGFFNNAIALCNKILRSSPGRSTVYYKLGKVNAHKGFKADAKTNFLEYADRMQKAGQVDEAFRALAEFADLCPDQTDIRLMLADQLTKAGKSADAVEQLQILHEQLDREGRAGEAEAAAARMKAIDPSVEPRTAGSDGIPKASTGGGDDLVFLDLSDTPKAAQQRQTLAQKRATSTGMKAMTTPTGTPASMPAQKAPPVAPPKKAASPPPPPPPPPAAAKPVAPPVIEPEPVVEAEPVIEPELMDVSGSLDPTGAGSLDIQSTSLADTSTSDAFGGDLLEIETTSLTEPPRKSQAMPPPVDIAPIEVPPAEDSSGGTLDFIMPDSGPSSPAPEPVSSEIMDLPLVDGTIDLPEIAPLEMPAPVAEAPLEAADLEDLAHLETVRPSTAITAKSVDALQRSVDGNPEDWSSRRELAEALLESGDRENGLRELETAMLGYERSGDLSTAMSVADEIVRLDPSSVKHLQKRVEYSYRTNDRAQLVESYLSLADALFRSGQVDKSRTIYQRVIELSPDDIRAQAALSTMPAPAAPEPPKKTPAGPPKAAPKTPAPLESVKPTPLASDAFVNLGDWLRDDEGPKDTRMVVAEEEPTGNEQADFADMLKKFKQGVAENVEAEDYQSHYDLGVAYKEMGLIDEAIAEFQKALRGPGNRVRTYEAIGQCFIEKGQNSMAATILSRALSEKGASDELLVGVLYLLGRANEAQGKTDEALQFYQRVFIVDISFHDVAERLNALENAAK
jgi:tetratricopeptide (TPR) repeat protein